MSEKACAEPDYEQVYIVPAKSFTEPPKDGIPAFGGKFFIVRQGSSYFLTLAVLPFDGTKIESAAQGEGVSTVIRAFRSAGVKCDVFTAVELTDATQVLDCQSTK